MCKIWTPTPRWTCRRNKEYSNQNWTTTKSPSDAFMTRSITVGVQVEWPHQQQFKTPAVWTRRAVYTSSQARHATRGSNQNFNNISNEYLERLSRTGPKSLPILYKYILSKFNAYNMNAHTHTCTRTHRRTHTHTHTHQSHIRAMRLKKRFLKRERFSRKI